MKSKVLLDTGPLVAYFSYDDANHNWSVAQFRTIAPPLLTCEAVISEAIFLLQRDDNDCDFLWEVIDRGVVQIPFRAKDHHLRIRELMRKYSDQPMSLADSCLVCMAELWSGSRIFTTDVRDFSIYRVHERNPMPCLRPAGSIDER